MAERRTVQERRSRRLPHGSCVLSRAVRRRRATATLELHAMRCTPCFDTCAPPIGACLAPLFAGISATRNQRDEVHAFRHADDAVIVVFDLLGAHRGPLRGVPPTGPRSDGGLVEEDLRCRWSGRCPAARRRRRPVRTQARVVPVAPSRRTTFRFPALISFRDLIPSSATSSPTIRSPSAASSSRSTHTAYAARVRSVM